MFFLQIVTKLLRGWWVIALKLILDNWLKPLETGSQTPDPNQPFGTTSFEAN